MSTREIGQMTPVGVLDTSALFEIEQGGNSFRTNLADMIALHTTNLSALVIDANKDWLTFDITNLGNFGQIGYHDMAEIATPANPAVNTGRFYVADSAGTTTAFFVDSAGTITNLLTGIETPVWTQNHDANGFALLNARFGGGSDPTKIMEIDLSAMSTATTLNILVNQTTTQSLNIPNITANDEIVTELFTQQLSNKTLIVPIISDFSNADHTHQDAASGGQLDSTLALSDTGDIAYLNTPNAYVAGNRQDFLGDTGGTSGLNVGGIAGNPLTQVDGDLWLNTSTNQIFARINGVDVDLSNTGLAPPFDDDNPLVQDEADNTKLLRFDVTGNTTGIEGVIATIFTTVKTITIPDANDTLVGKATTDTFTNKIFNTDAAGNQLIQSTPVVGQYLRDDGTEFLGSAILIGDLPAGVVRTDQTNVYDDFDQDFRDGRVRIANPANSFHYAFASDAILADRTITLPLLIGNDVMVTEAHSQTLTNKALGTGTSWTAAPTITNGLTIVFNPDDTNAGINVGQNANEPSAPVNGDIFYDSTAGFIKGRNNGVWEQLGGEITTWTADHDAAGFDLLNVGGITINNPADTFQYIITPLAIVADRILNLPLLTATDTLVAEAFTQTLTNKTIDSASNTITITKSDISDMPITTVDIADNAVNFAKMENLNTQTFIGRDTAGIGDPEELSASVATTILNEFTDTLKGLVPLSGGGTTNFLRADGTWIPPAQTPWLSDIDASGFDLLNVGGITINNPADTFQYILTPDAIVADRIVNLPLLISTDTLVMEAHIQTLTNKVIDAASNTITNIGASEIESGIITDQTSLVLPVEAADELLIYDDSAGALRKVPLSDLVLSLFTVAYSTDAPASNQFFVLNGGNFTGDGTELNQQAPMAINYTLDRMAIHVNANGQAGAVVWNIRINGADGNQTISVGAGLTGNFQDVTNSDDVSAGDLVNYQIGTIGAGAFNVTGSSMVVALR